MLERVKQAFADRFGTPQVVVRAPGRINIIGEHTDYNEGLVLPAAVNQALYLAVGKATDASHLVALDIAGEWQGDIRQSFTTSGSWYDYLLGVVDLLRSGGYDTGNLHVVVGGNIPVGAGMSSSAAITCGFIYALDQLYGWQLSRQQMALLAQQVEHRYIGVQCGLMDQYAVLFGRKDHALLLDCRSMDYDWQPMLFKDYVWLLINTGVKHNLAATAYNQRREECRQGVYILRKIDPGINSLRDADAGLLAQARSMIPEQIYKRCLYVVEENKRVRQAVQAAAWQDSASLGRLLLASHAGLRDLYEVSCPELDFLVEQAASVTGVAGARMMGGGFGGCTLNLVRQDQVGEVKDRVGKAYTRQFGRQPVFYQPSLADGVEAISTANG